MATRNINIVVNRNRNIDVDVQDLGTQNVGVDVDVNGGGIPFGGTPGQVLTKTTSGYGWKDIDAAQSVNNVSYSEDRNIDLPAVKSISYNENEQELVIEEY